MLFNKSQVKCEKNNKILKKKLKKMKLSYKSTYLYQIHIINECLECSVFSLNRKIRFLSVFVL
jgi:hypothetical protein